MSFEPPDYAAELRTCVRGYYGAHARAILRAPDVFELFSSLFADERVMGESRRMVSAVLAYFVAPRDVMPEEDLGPVGLLDDLYVAAHVFRILNREISGAILNEAWSAADAPMNETMAEVYTESRAGVGKLARNALRLAGL